jgi:hypothetical protein
MSRAGPYVDHRRARAAASRTLTITAVNARRGDAAFCSDGCRQDQMDMDAALKAAARRQRVLRRMSSSASTGVMARRPTIAVHAPFVSSG